MRLLDLKIRWFRNLEQLDYEPSAGLNLIVGDNGQGKTNVLEAIHWSLLGRSFRTRRDDECLPWEGPKNEAESTSTRARYLVGSRQSELKMTLGRGWKRSFLDGVLIERLADLWSDLTVVTFCPADVDLFRSSPGRRRRLMDQILCQSSPLYLEELRRYQMALKQVNAVLKRRRGSDSRGEAEAFYPLLADSGAILLRSRRELVIQLNELGRDLFGELGGKRELELIYLPSMKESNPEQEDRGLLVHELTDRLIERHNESERFGMLAIGPHRDDLRVALGGRDLGRFGSQGQHRLVALTMKLASAELLRRDLDDPPILLLDDFGSELDAARRQAVLDRLRDRMQTFVTATSPDDLGSAIEFDKTSKIHAGRWMH